MFEFVFGNRAIDNSIADSNHNQKPKCYDYRGSTDVKFTTLNHIILSNYSAVISTEVDC